MLESVDNVEFKNICLLLSKWLIVNKNYCQNLVNSEFLKYFCVQYYQFN